MNLDILNVFRSYINMNNRTLSSYRPSIIDNIISREDKSSDFPDIKRFSIRIDPFSIDEKLAMCNNNKHYIGTLNFKSDKYMDVFYLENSKCFLVGISHIAPSKLFSYYNLYKKSNNNSNDDVIFYACIYIMYVRYTRVLYETLPDLPINDFIVRFYKSPNILSNVVIKLLLCKAIMNKFRLHLNTATMCVNNYIYYILEGGSLDVNNVRDIINNMNIIKVMIYLGKYKSSKGDMLYINQDIATQVYEGEVYKEEGKFADLIEYINNNKDLVFNVMKYIMSLDNNSLYKKKSTNKTYMLLVFYNILTQNKCNTVIARDVLLGKYHIEDVIYRLRFTPIFHNDLRYVIESLFLMKYINCPESKDPLYYYSYNLDIVLSPLVTNHIYYHRNQHEYINKKKNGMVYIPKIRLYKIRERFDFLYNDLYDESEPVFGIYDIKDELPQYYHMDTVANLMSHRKELLYSYEVHNDKEIYREMNISTAEELHELMRCFYANHPLTDILLSLIKEKKFLGKTKIEKLSDDNKTTISNFYIKLFEVGMIIRRWKKEDGNNYPMLREQTLPGKNGISEGDLDIIMTNIHIELNKMLKDMKQVVKSFISVNKCFSINGGIVYKETNIHGGYILDILKHVFLEPHMKESESLCRRVSSNIFIATAYYYMKELFDYTFEGFNIKQMEYID